MEVREFEDDEICAYDEYDDVMDYVEDNDSDLIQAIDAFRDVLPDIVVKSYTIAPLRNTEYERSFCGDIDLLKVLNEK
ncbi:MAG: hypothetical protein K6A39_05500 [Clostridiales bacterium]|nr:hypothetical protein [Clostridiales bacterium]